MVGMAATGTLSYNGYTFDGTAKITVQVDPVRDESNRTVIYHKHTINVKAIVQSDGGTDGQLMDIRSRLGAQGAPLVFINHGFGTDLIVNQSAGGATDVRWGPIPEVISWRPIGSAQACEIEWRVTTCVPGCILYGTSRDKGVTTINYDMRWSISEKGYTTRAINGYLEIAQTRDMAGNVPDSADVYRDIISPTVPTGFQRSQSWSLSKDKSRLDFSITDKELETPNAYPLGVVEIDAKHRVAWSRRGGKSMTLRNTISVNIEMAKDQRPIMAHLLFLEIAAARINHARANGVPVLIDDANFEESLFSRKHSFSVSYRTLSCLKDLIADTGLWTPYNTQWNIWHFSMVQAFSHRGFANLAHLPASDALVNLCSENTTIPWNAESESPYHIPSTLPSALKNECPPEEKSWLDYASWIEVDRDRPVVRQSKLTEPDAKDPEWNPYASAIATWQAKQTKDVIQEGGESRYTFHLKGYGVRVCHYVPKPAVEKIGVANVVEVSSAFDHRVIANVMGMPVYAAKWDIEYVSDESPEDVKPDQNPKECVDKEGNAEDGQL